MEHDTSTYRKHIDTSGYILNEALLTNLLEETQEALKGGEVRLKAQFRTEGETQISVATIHQLVSEVRRRQSPLESLSIYHSWVNPSASASISFNRNGVMELVLSGRSPDLQVRSSALTAILQRCETDHNFLMKLLVKRSVREWILRLTMAMIVGLGTGFVVLSIYQVVAYSIGVDIDPNLVGRGNKIFQIIEQAIKSPSIDQKLDALLLAQIRGFDNVTSVIAQNTIGLKYLGVFVLSLGAFLMGYRTMLKSFPLSFFDLEGGSSRLARIQAAQDRWTNALVFSPILAGVAALGGWAWTFLKH